MSHVDPQPDGFARLVTERSGLVDKFIGPPPDDPVDKSQYLNLGQGHNLLALFVDRPNASHVIQVIKERFWFLRTDMDSWFCCCGIVYCSGGPSGFVLCTMMKFERNSTISHDFAIYSFLIYLYGCDNVAACFYFVRSFCLCSIRFQWRPRA